MPTELSVHAVHEGGMRFTATAGAHTIQTDYLLGRGESVGPKPLELLLASLATCTGGTLVVLLRRMKRPVDGIEVRARGTRRDEHPTVFTEIALELVVHGAGLDPAMLERALVEAEERLCPVWVMLKAGTPIRSTIRVVEA